MTGLMKCLAQSALVFGLAAGLSACGGGGGDDEGNGGGDPGSDGPPASVTVNLGDDRILEEGSDGGTTVVEFDVTLDDAALSDVTVEYTTTHITTEDNDLSMSSGVLRFAAGETASTIAVGIVADTAFELNEDFAVRLANPSSNATIGDGEAEARLLNDDALEIIFDVIYIGNRSGTLRGVEVEIDYDFFIDLADFGVDELLLPYDIYYESDVHLPFPVASGTLHILSSTINHRGRLLFVLPEGFGGLAVNGRFLVEFDWSALADGLPEAFWEMIGDASIQADDVETGMVMLSVSDPVVFNEGDAGEITDLVFAAELDAALDHDLILSYETVDHTATSPQDYMATSGTVIMSAGETAAEFTVAVNGDDEVEGSAPEVFRVALSTDSDLVILDFPWAVATIYDDEDDGVRQIRIGNAALVEGDSGSADMVFAATLDEAAVAPVTFRYATRDDTASAGSDYIETSGESTFLPGEIELAISVPILGDEDAEDDERFALEVVGTFDNGIAAGNGIGTIVTDDPIFRVSVFDGAVAEGDTGTVALAFTVQLSEPADFTIDVGYTTSEGSAESGSDYVSANSTLAIPAGETAGTIEIDVNGDTDVENDEYFELTITTSTADVVLSDDRATGTILNDDDAAGWSGAELVHRANVSGAFDEAVLPRVAFGPGLERHVTFFKNFSLWHTTSSVPGIWATPVQIAPVDSENYAAPLAFDHAGRGLVVVPNAFLEPYSFTPTSGWQVEPLPVAVEVAGTPVLARGPETGLTMAVWRDEANASNGFSQSVWAALFSAEDGWLDVGLVEQLPDAAFNPDVAMNSNGDAITVLSQGGDIVAYHFVGGVWQGPRVVDAIDTEIADMPSIDMNSQGDAAVVWRQAEPVTSGIARWSIYSSHYDSVSDQWSDPSLVEEFRDTQADAPDVAIDTDGNLFVIWLQRASSGSRHDLYGNRYDAASEQWMGAGLLEFDDTATSLSITEHQVVADNLGNAIVVWLQNDGTMQNLRTTRYSSDDGDWDPASFLEENDSGDAYRPHLVIDRATGAAMVVWFQQDGFNRDIWANRYRGN